MIRMFGFGARKLLNDSALRTPRELTDTEEEHFISAISTFEIARLLHLGLLRLKHTFAEWKELSMAELRALPIDLNA